MDILSQVRRSFSSKYKSCLNQASGPVCVVSLAVLTFSIPKIEKAQSEKNSFKRFDLIGGVLSVAWPIPFTFAIQEGGTSYSWNSSVIIGTLVGGIVGFFVFIAWEVQLDKKGKQDPVFPMRLLANPVVSLVFMQV
jgi:uncharacterized membrane protein YdcZ (DUF606 family)